HLRSPRCLSATALARRRRADPINRPLRLPPAIPPSSRRSPSNPSTCQMELRAPASCRKEYRLQLRRGTRPFYSLKCGTLSRCAKINPGTGGNAPCGERMTIDERLDRLTERHEALTGHVEILTADVAQLTSDIKDMRSTMKDLMTGFSTLVELAKSHETRIERLEGR